MNFIAIDLPFYQIHNKFQLKICTCWFTTFKFARKYTLCKLTGDFIWPVLLFLALHVGWKRKIIFVEGYIVQDISKHTDRSTAVSALSCRVIPETYTAEFISLCLNKAKANINSDRQIDALTITSHQGLQSLNQAAFTNSWISQKLILSLYTASSRLKSDHCIWGDPQKRSAKKNRQWCIHEWKTGLEPV